MESGLITPTALIGTGAAMGVTSRAMGVMEHLNWGYIQLGLVALVFGGLQVWWISSVLWRRNLAKPQSGGEFRKSLERIWKKEQQS